MEQLREAAVLTAPGEAYVRERITRRRMPLGARRRDVVENFPDAEDDGGYNTGRRRTGLRLTFPGGMPQSLWGRLAAASAFLAILAIAWVAAGIVHRMVLHDDRFVLASGSSILTQGNHHLSRSQLLDVFGGDIERNILRVSLNERKAELEQIPWVKQATVMRLLPDHISILVEERKPVAFARGVGHMELVDSGGVLLKMEGKTAEDLNYSLPVVTGISQDDPLSVRAARMNIFHDFTRDLDISGEGISAKLSEIDLSDPEDVKALIPDRGSDVLVHFGDSDFLDRFRKYEAHLTEWRAQYPKLASVDMRYERQVVLEMQPGTAVPARGDTQMVGDQASLPAPKMSTAKTSLSIRPHLGAKSPLPSRPARRLSKTGQPSHTPPLAVKKAGNP